MNVLKGAFYWENGEGPRNCPNRHILVLGSCQLLPDWRGYVKIDAQPRCFCLMWHLEHWPDLILSGKYLSNGPLFTTETVCFSLAVIFYLHFTFMGEHHLLMILFYLHSLYSGAVVVKNYHLSLGIIGSVVNPIGVVIYKNYLNLLEINVFSTGYQFRLEIILTADLDTPFSAIMSAFGSADIPQSLMVINNGLILSSSP